MFQGKCFNCNEVNCELCEFDECNHLHENEDDD